MRNILDDIDNAVAQLQGKGEQAVMKAVGAAKDAFGKAGDSIERAVDSAKDALADAIERLTPVDAIPETPTENAQAEEAEQPEEKPLTAREEIDQDVAAQLNQIRAAQQTPGAFSDYIAKKYGKNS